MKLILNAVLIFSVLVLAVHGYLMLMYGTLSPCEAAMKRAQQYARETNDVVVGIGSTVLDALDMEQEAFEDRNVLKCYQAALFGFDAERR